MKSTITFWNWFTSRATEAVMPRRAARPIAIEPLEARIAPATILVTSLGDDFVVDGKVTLAEAIKAANSDTSIDGSVAGSGANTITFAPGLTAGGPATIHLTSLFAATADDRSGLGATDFGPTAFKITSGITIQGPTGDNGITIQRDAGSSNFRLFHVAAAGNLALQNLTLTGGSAHGFNGGGSAGGEGGGSAGLGGAIFNQGTLAVDHSTLSGNSATGGNGVNASGSTNGAGGAGVGAAGANATAFNFTGGNGGGPNGGAAGTTPSAAGGDALGQGGGGGGGSTGGAGAGASPGGPGGGGGFGGGGGGSGASVNISGPAGGAGGFGGGGGGSGGVQLGFVPGGGGISLFGGGAGGGGGVGGSGTGVAGGGGGGGGAGMGGAVFNHGGAVSFVDSTIAGNSATGGNGGGLAGNGGTASGGGGGFGGGLFNLDGALSIVDSTFADNTVAAGGGVTPGQDGGAVYNLDLHAASLPTTIGSLYLKNSILANSVGAANELVNNAGKVFGNHNLVETNSGAGAPGVITSIADPLLGALAANGGPTKTYALKPGSPAREAGSLSDEIQKFTVGGGAGTFTLTFNGQTTSAIASTATPAQVETALNTLSTIGGAAAVIASGNVFTVTFGGSLGSTNQNQMTVATAGGTTVSFSTTQNGGSQLPSDDQRGKLRPLDGDNNGVALNDLGAVEAPNPFATATLTAGAGPWTVKLVGNQATLTDVNGIVLFQESQDALTRLDILGTNANDTLIVDSTNGLVSLLEGISFDGGKGSDTLKLVQTGGAQTSDVYNVGPGPGDGSSVITGATGTQTVYFTNLEPVLDTVPAASLTVNATNADNAISYRQAAVVTNGLVAVDEFETIEFSNKTALTINALGGSDTISLNNPNTPTGLTGAISVNGGDPAGSDTLIVNGTNGSDDFDFAASGAGSAKITGFFPAINVSAMEHVIYDGQGGPDLFEVVTPAGDSLVDFFPGNDATSGSFRLSQIGGSTLLGFDYANVDASGSSIDVFLGGDAADQLQVHGTADADQFTVDGSGNVQILGPTLGAPIRSIPITAHGTPRLVLIGGAGADLFDINAPALFTDRIVVDGGAAADGNSVKLRNATGAVGIVLADSVAFTNTVVSGYGAPVTLLGVDTLTIDANLKPVTLTGTGEAEDLHVTPEAMLAAAITKTGFGLTIHTANNDQLTIDGAGSTDTVTVHGPNIGSVIGIVKGATSVVAVGALGTSINVPSATTEAINLVGGSGADTFNVAGTTNGNQLVNIIGGSPSSNAGAAADTVNVTLSTAGTTALVPGATPDAGAITSPDGTTSFSGIELVTLTGAAGANTLNLQGTHASDTMAVQFLGGANRTWINDRAVASFANFATVNVNGLFGDDKFSIAPVGLVGVTAVNVAGGDPTASDELVITGTAAADTFTFTGSSPSAGTVTITGAAPVAFTTTENVILDGQAGADHFLVASANGRVQLRGGDDSDTVDFTGAAMGVIFDLDAVGVDQHVNPTGEIINLGDVIENFTGTAFNDILHVKASTSTRTLNGGVQATLPPGDSLVFDGNGAVVNLIPVDSNTGTFKTIGYADVAFDEFETTSIVNSPSGPGGFGTPGNSNAFTTAHIYDLLPVTSGGKPAPGKGPRAVVTGDLNADGFADLVVANASSKNLDVLINKGDGTFFDPVNVSSFAIGAQDIVIGDFNGDTKLDVVISYPAMGKIAVFNGDGAGGFAAPTLIATPKFKPFALAVGRMDAGATLDLVATSRDTGAVEVLLGNGAGSFTAGIPIKTLGKQPVDVVLADFNADGTLDVATANYGTNNVSFFSGNGLGGLGTEVRRAAGIHPSALAVGDLNADGKLDLAVSNTASPFVSVLLGQGSGAPATQFASQLRVAVPGLHQSTAIVVGDFNGDGVADLGLGNRFGTNFTILLGTGLAAYTQPFEFNLGKNPNFATTGGIAIADFNNDGLLDVIATSLTTNDVRVLLRHG